MFFIFPAPHAGRSVQDNKGGILKQFNLILYFLLSALILSGCASSLPYVQNYTIPFEKGIYSILPPQGKDWVYSEQNDSIVFGKRDGATHTYTAQISEPVWKNWTET